MLGAGLGARLEPCLRDARVGEPSVTHGRWNSWRQRGTHTRARSRCVVTFQLRALHYTMRRAGLTTAGEVAPRPSLGLPLLEPTGSER
jgi:hypothetical protein